MILCKFVFLENFQKLLGGWWIAARRLIHLLMVSGFLRGTAWQ